MGTVAGLIGIIIIWALFGVAVRAATGTVRAAARTAMGKGSFGDNFHAAVVGMGAIEARILDSRVDATDKSSPVLKIIEVKGILPTNQKRRLGFVTSVLDKTSGELEPVMCGLEIFQEPHTIAYQNSMEVGSIDPGTGFVSWVRVGVVAPELIQTAYGGARNLVAVLRLLDLDHKPDITQGFHEANHAGLLWQKLIPFEWTVKSKGYLEAAEQRDKARTLSVQIAMGIAMWDGALGNREGNALHKWVQKILTGYADQRREKVKIALNSAMKESFEAASKKTLSIPNLTKSLKEIGDVGTKYEAIELCYDVLGSGDIKGSDEVRIIDLVAKALELDLVELERIRDTKIIGLDVAPTKEMTVEDLVGIDRNWEPSRVKNYLRNEFQKWNNRLTTLPEGDERNKAQAMLEAIAEARKKYG